jgi:hypothetical protein
MLLLSQGYLNSNLCHTMFFFMSILLLILTKDERLRPRIMTLDLDPTPDPFSPHLQEQRQHIDKVDLLFSGQLRLPLQLQQLTLPLKRSTFSKFQQY